MKKLFVLSLLLGFAACTSNQETNNSDSTEVTMSLLDQVNSLLDSDQYVEALALLDEQQNTEETLLLKEKTHLNYGLYLEYRDSNVTNMRDKMNGALRQYVEVLRINPDNEKAITEIEQILGIYSTFPDRSPDPDIMEDLEELGF